MGNQLRGGCVFRNILFPELQTVQQSTQLVCIFLGMAGSNINVIAATTVCSKDGTHQSRSSLVVGRTKRICTGFLRLFQRFAADKH